MTDGDAVQGLVTVSSKEARITGDESAGIVVNINGAAQASVAAGNITVVGDEAIGVYFNATAATPLTMTSGAIRIEGDNGYGISMTNAGVSNFDLGSITMTGDASYAIEAVGTGAKTILADLIRIEGDNSFGVMADGESVTLDLDNVEVLGASSYGVRLTNEDSNVDLTIRNATVSGEESVLADVTADAFKGDFGTIRMGAAAGQSIDIVAGSADVTIRDLESLSETAEGVRVLVTANRDTFAPDADAPVATGSAVVNVGRIRTSANNADGDYDAALTVVADNDVTVNGLNNTDGTRGGLIQTTGDGNRGVDVRAETGEVKVTLRNVQTTGDHAAGVHARNGAEGGPSTDKKITIDVMDISTTGIQADGVDVVAQNAEVFFNSISATGGESEGVSIRTEGEGAVTVRGGAIAAEDIGLLIAANNTLEGGLAAVTANVDSITTTGSQGAGVKITARSADLTLGAVATTGANAHGVAVNATDRIGVKILRSIATDTNDSVALQASSENDDVVVDAGAAQFTTKGRRSTAISLGGRNVTVTAGSVTTEGPQLALGIDVSASQAGAVTVGAVETRGVESVGVRVNAGTTASVTSNLANSVISTHGNRSSAVEAYSDTLTQVLLNRVITRGDMSHGVSASGRTVEVTAADIRTEGRASDGVVVSSDQLVDLALGNVLADGEGSRGVFVEGTGDITLEAGSIRTTKGAYSGEHADAVTLRTTNGYVSADIGSVSTVGAGATAIDIAALRNSESPAERIEAYLRADTVATEGAEAVGVKVQSGDLADIDIGTITGRSTLIDAVSEGQMTLTVGHGASSTTGSAIKALSTGDDVTFNVATSLSALNGVAAEIESQTGAIDAAIARGAQVRGGSVGLQLTSETGTHLIIEGSISAESGLAFNIDGGAATVDNRSNTIIGRIDLTENDDVVNNSGRFTASGVSDYGAGTDVFNNSGIIDMPESTVARTASFINLERLNNTGVIDLANGVAGDLFQVSGVINGQTGNSIELDLDARGATPIADRIVAGGFEGVSNILLSVQGRASLGDTGVVIAESDAAQTGQEMTVRVAGGGFVGFSLLFADGEFRLNGELAPPAFEPTKVASGAQHQWTSGADVVSARFDQMRDEGGRAEGRGDQVWTQVYGGSNDIEAQRSFELFGETLDADLSHEVKSQGVQAGVDRAVPVENGALVFGMLAGAGKTELRFQNGDVTEYDGVGVGAYGHWFSGPLSIGVLAKLDTFKLDYDWAEANLKTRSDGFTVGARVDAAWRIQAGQGWYVEPQASISWSDTALGRMKARDGAEVVFGDTRSMVGRIGVRAGAEMTVGDGLSFKPFAAVHALNEFEGDNASTLILGDEAVAVADRAHGAWGRAVLGASVEAPSGLGAFIQAEGDFGEVEGFTARAGVKFSW